MRTKLIIARAAITFLFAAVCISAGADGVTEERALQQARQFVGSHSTRKAAPTVSPAGQVSGLYVFNVSGNGGFVIVSNDDQTTPILGFSLTGNLDTNDLPDNMRAWLQGYADQIAWLQQRESEAGGLSTLSSARSSGAGRMRRAEMTSIEPLVVTKWNQGKPYNNLCPEIDGTKTVTGCVATTVAQLMNYHKWPEAECAPLASYKFKSVDKGGNSDSLTVDDLVATTFEWKNMIANYTPVNPETGKRYLAGTEQQQAAVAKLMQYCGAALHMKYGLGANGGSSAYSEAIPYVMRDCFGYDGGVRHCYRKNYSYQEWVEMIYRELAGKRPVALGGQSTGGGHSFVCDGYLYDNADFFHINWGWAGDSDGYFPLSVLSPDEQGIGGSSTLDGFSFGQDAVIGIQRPVDGNKDYCLSMEGLTLGDTEQTSKEKTWARGSETEDFTGISLCYTVVNLSYGNSYYDVSVQMVDGSGNVVLTLGGLENQPMTWGKDFSGTLTGLSIPASVGSGTYYIKVVSRPHCEPAVAWQECADGEAFALTATIDGNQLTIGVPKPRGSVPASVEFTVKGESVVGAEQTVTATITGGESDYAGDLVLRVEGSAVMGVVAQIPAGEKVVLTFSYIASQVGSNTLTLWTKSKKGTQIQGSKTVDISTLVVDNDGENNTGIIESNNGRTGNVKLEGRTLYKDGKWNTLCLPFNLTDGQMADSPLAGATVMELDVEGEEDGSYKTRLDSDGTLYLSFTKVSEITAGTPYIVKWVKDNGYDNDDPQTRDVNSPVFAGVTLCKDFNDYESKDGKVQFLGRYSARTYSAQERSVLLLGADNTLYYPQPDYTDTTDPKYSSIGACRAYFKMSSAAPIRAFRLNFSDQQGSEGSEAGIVTLSADYNGQKGGNERYYDLQGRQLSGKPARKGVYVSNGKLMRY